MADIRIIRLFSGPFLSQFTLAPQTLPFTDREVVSMDQDLVKFEQAFLKPEVEKYLISKNVLMASFAISKAENSMLTLAEAEEVYNLVLANADYDFVGKKVKEGKNLSQKDHDKLEFFNIAKTFRLVNEQKFSIAKLTPEFVREIHAQVTAGLDIFSQYLSEFTPYKAGKWRDNDLVRVGQYVPAPCSQIAGGVDELTSWLKGNLSPTNIAIFHTALYGLHPFNNGNKRVCRILEHLLLRCVGLNNKNLYSTSYYYHKEKSRYYKNLLWSIERKNLNHFCAFVMEALVISLIWVVKTSLEARRSEFLDSQRLDNQERAVLRPLIKRGELQFKALAKKARGKVSRQTLVNYLQKGVENKILLRREVGKATYYQLNVQTAEKDTIEKWLDFVKGRLEYIPDEVKLA